MCCLCVPASFSWPWQRCSWSAPSLLTRKPGWFRGIGTNLFDRAVLFFSSKSSGVNEASKPGWRHPWARQQEFYGLSLHVLGSIFATAKRTLFLQARPAAFQRQRSGEKKGKKIRSELLQSVRAQLGGRPLLKQHHHQIRTPPTPPSQSFLEQKTFICS